MSGFPWLDFLWAGHSLYLWGSYLAALGVVLVEVALLALRERTILGHLGWSGPDLPGRATPRGAGREIR